MNMNRKIFALVLLVGGILFWVFWKSPTSTDHSAGDRDGSGSGQSSKAGGGDEVTGAEGASESATPEPPRFAAGAIDEFHKHYGDPSRRPVDDLDLLYSLFYLYVSNFKNPDDIPTEGNQAIYRALSGQNPDNIVFIRKDFSFVNDEGEILDRWGKPLYFHFYHPKSPGIISGGEDGQLWTEDDVKFGQ